MSDEFEKWQRLSSRSERSREQFVSRASNVQRQGSPKDNPYAREAARDRAFFLWGITIVILVGVAAVLIFGADFFVGRRADGPPAEEPKPRRPMRPAELLDTPP